MSSYYNVMSQVLSAVHPGNSSGDASQLARNVVDYEIAMAGVLPSLDEAYDVNVWLLPWIVSAYWP